MGNSMITSITRSHGQTGGAAQLMRKDTMTRMDSTMPMYPLQRMANTKMLSVTARIADRIPF